jgi:glutamyl-tRNA synthetase
MSDPVRVRFAPSPTGYLHVGGARTALFNWLYARKVGGKLLLRIEDTDRERSSEEHVQVILEGLAWLGLDYDEDIVYQGAGIQRHQALADRLLAEGKAYEEEGAIRFRMPAEEIAWEDAVYGVISFKGEDIKDWVILRSDRTPTYNFTVVADDLDRGVPRAGTPPPDVRPPAHDPRTRREEALQAPRRHRGGRLSQRGHPAGGDAELPCPAGLEPR